MGHARLPGPGTGGRGEGSHGRKSGPMRIVAEGARRAVLQAIPLAGRKPVHPVLPVAQLITMAKTAEARALVKAQMHAIGQSEFVERVLGVTAVAPTGRVSVGDIEPRVKL